MLLKSEYEIYELGYNYRACDKRSLEKITKGIKSRIVFPQFSVIADGSTIF